MVIASRKQNERKHKSITKLAKMLRTERRSSWIGRVPNKYKSPGFNSQHCTKLGMVIQVGHLSMWEAEASMA